MKQAFTMIELIFVIVIIGILSAVAIPKIAASRDDAQIVAAAKNISTIISDIRGFYTTQGVVRLDIGQMTSVSNPIRIDNNACFTLANPATINAVTIGVTIGTTGRCADVWLMPAMASLSIYLAGTDGGNKPANTFVIGGITIGR